MQLRPVSEGLFIKKKVFHNRIRGKRTNGEVFSLPLPLFFLLFRGVRSSWLTSYPRARGI